MLQEEQRENKQSRQTFPSVLIGGRVNIYTCYLFLLFYMQYCEYFPFRFLIEVGFPKALVQIRTEFYIFAHIFICFFYSVVSGYKVMTFFP